MARSISPTSLILITGATGHVGFRTLVHALRSGLNVRVTVRSHGKAVQLLNRICLKVPSLDPTDVSIFTACNTKQQQRLTFTIIPDITVDGAFDTAMEGVTQVIHIASPLTTGSQKPPIGSDLADDLFIRPAVQGTLSLLEAAERCGTVRRVVITSSIVALIPVAQMEGTEARPANTPVRPTDRVPFTPGPYHSEFAAYANSKMAALHAAEKWYEATGPAFDIVHLHPSFVLGRNDMASTTAQCMKGTNAMVLAMLLGKRFGPFAGATVHVDDVARCHVDAAVGVRRVPGNTSYILNQKSRWNDAKEMVKASFPRVMKSKVLVDTGNVDTTDIQIDARLAEDTFGIHFRGFQDQVKSLVRQFLDLRMSPRGGQGVVSRNPGREKRILETPRRPFDMNNGQMTTISI